MIITSNRQMALLRLQISIQKILIIKKTNLAATIKKIILISTIHIVIIQTLKVRMLRKYHIIFFRINTLTMKMMILKMKMMITMKII